MLVDYTASRGAVSSTLRRAEYKPNLHGFLADFPRIVYNRREKTCPGQARRPCLGGNEETMPLQKNQIVRLSITGMTAEGNGVGRVPVPEDGQREMAVFVPFTAIGDEIDCRIVKVARSHAFGRVEALVFPSPDRLPSGEDSGCPVFGKCGGCAFRHVRYEAELQYKWQRVADAVKRIGGLDITPQPILGAEQPDGYRNKAQYPVAPGENRPLIGFFAPRSHRIVEEHHCRLQPPVFGTAVDIIARWAQAAGASGYDEQTGSGLLRHIYIRQAEATGEVMVCLVCTSGKIPSPGRLVDALREGVPGLASVMVNINRERTNVILGKNEFVLWGDPYITDVLCGLRFRLSPQSFYQVNRRQAERLYGLAAEEAALTGTETLLDLYCGTGTIGLSMASRAGRIIGVEAVAPAVEDARRNAQANGIANARFLCADAAEAAAQLREEGISPDVVILDPPRKGCDAALIETVAAMSPGRIVYVSCDPATLARDLARFGEEGYRTRRVTPVDMFPRTPHVETVCKLVRE